MDYARSSIVLAIIFNFEYNFVLCVYIVIMYKKFDVRDYTQYFDISPCAIYTFRVIINCDTIWYNVFIWCDIVKRNRNLMVIIVKKKKKWHFNHPLKHHPLPRGYLEQSLHFHPHTYPPSPPPLYPSIFIALLPGNNLPTAQARNLRLDHKTPSLQFPPS